MTCTYPGCANPVLAKQYCSTHYTRLRKHGSVDIVLPPNGGQKHVDRTVIGQEIHYVRVMSAEYRVIRESGCSDYRVKALCLYENCGTEFEVIVSELLRTDGKTTKSCGCYQRVLQKEIPLRTGQGAQHPAYKDKESIVAQREAWLDSEKRNPCTDCKQQFPRECMSFDHRLGYREEGDFDLTNSGIKGKSWKELYGQREKCDLVCLNCHAIRTHNYAQQQRRLRLNMTPERLVQDWHKYSEQYYEFHEQNLGTHTQREGLAEIDCHCLPEILPRFYSIQETRFKSRK